MLNGKMKTIYILLLLAMCSCGDKIVREQLTSTLVSDSILSPMPGTLICAGRYVVWEDCMEVPVVHVLNASNGQEVKTAVTLGQAVGDFQTPEVCYYNDDTLYVRDLNSMEEAYIDLSSRDSKYVKKEIDRNGYDTPDVFIPLDDKSYYSMDAFSEVPFAYCDGDTVKKFGHYPIGGEYENTYLFQGYVGFNPARGVFVYGTSCMPYVALYDCNNDFALEWESNVDVGYTISNNQMKLDKGVRHGCYGMALTQSYIVTMEYDYERSDVKEIEGRDMKMLPKTLVLRAYDGNVLKIVDLGMPILRIAGQVNSDVLYAIVVDPEYKIVKCEL